MRSVEWACCLVHAVIQNPLKDKFYKNLKFIQIIQGHRWYINLYGITLKINEEAGTIRGSLDIAPYVTIIPSWSRCRKISVALCPQMQFRASLGLHNLLVLKICVVRNSSTVMTSVAPNCLSFSYSTDS